MELVNHSDQWCFWFVFGVSHKPFRNQRDLGSGLDEQYPIAGEHNEQRPVSLNHAVHQFIIASVRDLVV